MSYGLSIVTAPTEEPLTLAEAKNHLRVETALTDDDDLITSLIVAARQFCEDFTGRALVSQTWDYTLDQFPVPNINSVIPANIHLPRPNLQSVTSITWLDSSGAPQTLATDQYIVDTGTLPGTISRGYGVSWPIAQGVAKSVTVRFVCGYGDAAAVPDGIKAAMKLLIGGWYEGRESFVDARFANEIPYSVTALLSQYRVIEAT